MPQGIGRLREAAKRKFPRTYGIYEHYHTTITALTIIAFVAVVAYIGINQQQTETTVTHIRGDVNIIKRQSACSPRRDGKPRNAKACKANFNTIIHKILTPLQACEFLERGAPLIKIGGQPIPHVECVESRPASKSSDQKPSGAKQKVSTRHGGSTGRQTAAAPAEHIVTSTNPSPSAGTHTGSMATHHPSPNGDHHGGVSAGSHKTPHPHPAPAPVAPESHPEPTPTIETASSSETGTTGTGEQGGSTGSETETTTPPPVETSATKPKLLPEVIGPIEELACGLTGKPICHE